MRSYFLIFALLTACVPDEPSCGGDMSGAWSVTFEEMSGNCGYVPRQTQTLELDVWESSPETCELRSIQVQDFGNATITEEWVLFEVSDQRLEGELYYEMLAKPGQTDGAGNSQCTYIYRVVWERA